MRPARFHRPLFWVAAVLLLLAGTGPALAVRVGDAVDVDTGEMVADFFGALFDWGSDRDTSKDFIRWAVLGLVLLSINCALLGAFVVVRKVALIGDMLAHAVVPGVALGFLWKMEKNPFAIVVGAVLVGIVASLVMHAILRTTRLKQDAALALVLGSFYAIGVCLMKRVEVVGGTRASGLDGFWFGNAIGLTGPDFHAAREATTFGERMSALLVNDIALLAFTSVATVWILAVFYKTFLASSFDRDFTMSLGLPVAWLDRLLLLLVTFAIVVAMQAVGVVLVSAMLVIPAATAYLLCDRMHSMLWVSALCGAISALVGAFCSVLDTGLPTGPFLVIAAACLFALAFLFGTRHGWLAKRLRNRSRRERVERENTLKAMYRVLEDQQFETDAVELRRLAEQRRESVDVVRSRVETLVRAGSATLEGDHAFFTPEGYQTACKVVRNHRLWELYLTKMADYEADHVHDDAEEIEHVLGEEAVRKLERALAFPHKDPHGSPIPSIRDLTTLQPGGNARGGGREQHGYG